jgi:outer membrane protein assembly factor BamB
MKSAMRYLYQAAVLLPLMWLAGCGSTIKFTPAELVPLTNTPSIGQAWQSSVSGRILFPLQMTTIGKSLAVAGSQGVVAVIDAESGRDVWRIQLNAMLSSGIGFDGQTAAAVSLDNELLAIQTTPNAGVVAWRKALQARVYTAPLVAGGRVFVLAGDRSVQAFDAATGSKLWAFQRSSEPLILSQAGTLGVYRNALIVGNSGRLLALNPDNGQILWEASVATTRATNDIERLIDLVGAPNRVGDSVCVRAYQATVACVDAQKGQTVWSKTTQGSTGVSGNADQVVSAETDGSVKAWNRATGELLWTNSQLAHRGLSAPLLIGNSVVVGDFQGYVHVMNKADGALTARFQTDDSAIVAAPVVSGSIVVVATAKGGIFAFSPK